MHYNERVETTVLCMIYDKERILLQNRTKEDWSGMTFPGGHVKKKESFVEAVIREMKEETGLEIFNPRLCGVEHFSTDNDTRYLILLFKTDKYSGTLTSSREGDMMWVKRSELHKFSLVRNFMDVLHIFDCDEINELVYDTKDNLFPKYY